MSHPAPAALRSLEFPDRAGSTWSDLADRGEHGRGNEVLHVRRSGWRTRNRRPRLHWVAVVQAAVCLAVTAGLTPGCSCREQDGSISDRSTTRSPCGYLCKKERKIESIMAIHNGFTDVNEVRLRPECSAACDTTLTAILGTFQAIACWRLLSEEADRRWRRGNPALDMPFECAGPLD